MKTKLICPFCRDKEPPPRIGWNAYKVPAGCCPVCWYRYGRCIPMVPKRRLKRENP